jgi:hypothetical protein
MRAFVHYSLHRLISLFTLRRHNRYASVIIGSASPAIVTLLLIIFLGFSPSEFHPYYSDELHYWNEENTFSNVGFTGGYSIINEVPAKIYKSTFGPHGPGFPVAMSLYASVMGWSSLSPLIFNMLWLTFSIYLFLNYCGGSSLQKTLATFFLMTSFPIILFIPTGMQEALHQGIAIMLAAYIAYVMQCREGFSRSLSTLQSGILLTGICLASFVRPSWALLYALCMVPVIENSRNRLVKIGLSLTAIIVAYAFFYLFFSPTQNQTQLGTLQLIFAGEPSQILHFLEIIVKNTLHFFDWSQGEAFPATLLRYEILLVLVVCLFILYLNKKSLPENDKKKLLLASLILFVSIFSVVSLYEIGDWRDYRTLAPNFIAACLILTSVNKCSRLIMLLLFIQIISFAKCTETFELYRKNNFVALHEAKMYRARLHDVVTYTPGQSAWCNTLLIFTPGQENSISLALALEPGIGLSMVHKLDTLAKPIKSQYVLLDEPGKNQFNRLGLFDSFKPVASLNEIGMIYKNTNSGCDS